MSCRVEFVFSFEELLYASRSLWVAEGRVRRYTLAHEDCHRIEPSRFRVPPGQDPDDSSLRQVFKPWQNDDNESGYDEFKQTGPEYR